MDYIIASTSVTDEIHFADGKTVQQVAGGAGIYALCGVRLWSSSVMPVTGVGEDYAASYERWYRENGISMDGLIVKDAKTPYTVVQYFPDGERIETPRYGLSHYQKIEVTPRELEPYFQTAKGIYIFKNSNPSFWKEVLPMVRTGTAKVMWEIGNDATYLENKENVQKIASELSVFSINRTECLALLGADNLEHAVRELKSWGIPLIFLRCGKEGALMITPETCVQVPSVPGIEVIDPTGGGNSSSGAVLCGFCEGESLLRCGLMGSISAAMCLEQYGIPKKIGAERQAKAKELLERMEREVQQKNGAADRS